MKLLITGATGFLGTALTAALRRHGDIELVALGSKDCDLTDATAVRSLPHGQLRPDLPPRRLDSRRGFLPSSSGRAMDHQPADQHQRPGMVDGMPAPGQVDRHRHQLLLR